MHAYRQAHRKFSTVWEINVFSQNSCALTHCVIKVRMQFYEWVPKIEVLLLKSSRHMASIRQTLLASMCWPSLSPFRHITIKDCQQCLLLVFSYLVRILSWGRPSMKIKWTSIVFIFNEHFVCLPFDGCHDPRKYLKIKFYVQNILCKIYKITVD